MTKSIQQHITIVQNTNGATFGAILVDRVLFRSIPTVTPASRGRINELLTKELVTRSVTLNGNGSVTIGIWRRLGS